MAVMVKLKHVDSLKDGTFRFRRRYPKAVAQALGKDGMQERMKARDEVSLVREQAALMLEFDTRPASRPVARSLPADSRVSGWVGWNFCSRIDVAGIQHRREDALHAYLTTLEGSEVELRRNPSNSFDPNAIEVWFGSTMVGFVDANRAALASTRLPKDMPIRAQYVSGWRGDTGYVRLTIQPLMPDAKSRKANGWQVAPRS